MDDFSIYGDSFEDCLANLGKVDWEKCLFIVKKSTMLGHIISNEGIDVDKVKVDLIANLPLSTCVKDVQSFLRHAGFY